MIIIPSKNIAQNYNKEFEEMLSEQGSIVLVEWPERIKEILPKKHLTVHIDHVNEKERKITIK